MNEQNEERNEVEEQELAERWEAFRAHEIDAVMSVGQVDSPADWGLI